MTLTVTSRAKINLYLKVLYPRPDGYHELRTVFQSIGLADTIELSSRQDRNINLHCDHPDVPHDERNLCVQAARLLCQDTGYRTGVDIFLTKKIPVQGGLGGGSSNAASVLAGLCRLWDLHVSTQELMEMGSILGADVPFFLLGGTAVGIGKGDEVFSLPDLPPTHILLVCPHISVNTAWAYSKVNFILTRTGYDNKIPTSFRGLSSGEVFLQQGENDFEVAVFPEFPLLKESKDKLLEAGAQRAMLCGSGSTVFGLFDSETSCRKAHEFLMNTSVSGSIFSTRFIPREEYQKDLLFWAESE